MKDKYFKVLDKGFVALKDYMGSDEDIEQAARVSYGKGTRKVSETRGLIRYLMRHKHTTPFEMCEIKFHVKVPMDCWRQWIRHRTANVNEYSTRYSEAIDACQKTNSSEWRLQSKNNKQGSGGFLEEWPQETSKKIFECTPGKFLSDREQEFHTIARELYEERLELGVAKEQARKDLPLSNYTEAYWKCDLHNIFHFLKLRLDPHAQKEIRDYAYVIAGIVKELYPLSYEAFHDFMLNGTYFSLQEKQVLDQIYSFSCEVSPSTINVLCEEKGLSKREQDEFLHKISKTNIIDVQLDCSLGKTYEELNA